MKLRLPRSDRSNASRYLVLYLFFLLFMVYAVQDFLTSENTGVRNAERGSVHLTLLVILILLGLQYIHATRKEGIPRSAVMGSMWLIAGWIIAVDLVSGVISWSTAVHLGLSVLWILVYRFFSFYLRHYPRTLFLIQRCIMLLFGFYVLSAVYAALRFRVLYGRIIAVNLAYSVIVFLPWVSLMSSSLIRRLGFAFVCAVVLLSMKRGAIVVLPLMMAVGMMVEATVRRKAALVSVRIVSMMVVLLLALLAADHWVDGYLSQRFSLESLAVGSGRAQLYASALEDISRRTLCLLLIGRGSGSSGIGIHNEWLEFGYSYGLIGVLIYALFLASLARQFLRFLSVSSPLASGYAMVVVYIAAVGMYGQVYFAHSTVWLMAFLGTANGLSVSNASNQEVMSMSGKLKRLGGSGL